MRKTSPSLTPRLEDSPLELPEFQILKRQPKVPHVARVVAKRDVPNEYGTAVTYTVRQGRNGRDWWIDASLQGMRASDTLHTSKPETAAAWVRAVETGQVCVDCRTKRSSAEINRELDVALAKLDEKRRGRP